MSTSVPSDSSTIDTAFLVGPELVEFDRHDLPIYATPDTSTESRWADAGLDKPSYGTSLDRLFGDPGAIFMSGPIGAEEQAAALAATALPSEDPMVVLAGLSDGLILPASDTSDALPLPSGAQQAPEIVTIFDVGIDSFAVVHLHDGGAWDSTSDAWAFDYTS